MDKSNLTSIDVDGVEDIEGFNKFIADHDDDEEKEE